MLTHACAGQPERVTCPAVVFVRFAISPVTVRILSAHQAYLALQSHDADPVIRIACRVDLPLCIAEQFQGLVPSALRHECAGFPVAGAPPEYRVVRQLVAPSTQFCQQLPAVPGVLRRFELPRERIVRAVGRCPFLLECRVWGETSGRQQDNCEEETFFHGVKITKLPMSTICPPQFFVQESFSRYLAEAPGTLPDPAAG